MCTQRKSGVWGGEVVSLGWTLPQTKEGKPDKEGVGNGLRSYGSLCHILRYFPALYDTFYKNMKSLQGHKIINGMN